MTKSTPPSEPDNDRPAASRVPVKASGFQETVGYEITEWREGLARARLTVTEKHGNMSGNTHGGVYLTLMDAVGAFAGSYCPETGKRRRTMTLSMTTNFVGRPEGDTVIATGTLIGGGRSLFFSEIKVTDTEGNLVATGSGTYRYRSGGYYPEG